MALFFDKLTEPMKTWLVPSLVAYAIAASLVGYLQTMLNIRRGAILNNWQFAAILLLHFVWFGGFVAYNLYRGSIPLL